MSSVSTCDIVVRVLTYASSDQPMNEHGLVSNCLYHARKPLLWWKLSHGHFAQEDPIQAVDLHLCMQSDDPSHMTSGAAYTGTPGRVILASITSFAKPKSESYWILGLASKRTLAELTSRWMVSPWW